MKRERQREREGGGERLREGERERESELKSLKQSISFHAQDRPCKISKDKGNE